MPARRRAPRVGRGFQDVRRDGPDRSARETFEYVGTPAPAEPRAGTGDVWDDISPDDDSEWEARPAPSDRAHELGDANVRYEAARPCGGVVGEAGAAEARCDIADDEERILEAPAVAAPRRPSFISALYDIVDSMSNASEGEAIVSWSEDGDAFVVTNLGRFRDEVLRSHFVLGRWKSFYNKLNVHGFELRSDWTTSLCEFKHDNFRRGRPELLPQIQHAAARAAAEAHEQAVPCSATMRATSPVFLGSKDIAGARAGAVRSFDRAWGATHDGEPCPPARYAGWSVVLTGSCSQDIFVDAAGVVYRRRTDAARAMGILAGPMSESPALSSKYAKMPFGDRRALLLESGTPAAPPAAAAAAAPHPLPVAAEAELHGGTAEEEQAVPRLHVPQCLGSKDVAGARAGTVHYLDRAWGGTHDGEPCPPALYSGWSVVLTDSASKPIYFVDAAGVVYRRRKDAARAMGILAGPLSESRPPCQDSKYAKMPFGDRRALLLESGTPAAPAPPPRAAAAAAAAGKKRAAPAKIYPFSLKLCEMVSDAANHDVIRWNYDTRELEVMDENRLSADILPHYFKSNNIITFQRQLNYYGFSKIFRGTQTLPIYRNDDRDVATVEDLKFLPRRAVKRASTSPRARAAQPQDASDRGLPYWPADADDAADEPAVETPRGAAPAPPSPLSSPSSSAASLDILLEAAMSG